MTLTRIVLFVVAVALASASASAQGGSSDDNILYPQPALPVYIGPEIGYAIYDIDASFVVGDDGRACAFFSDAEGTGPTIGMRSFVYLTPWVIASARVRYEPRHARFLTPLDPEPVRDANDSIVMLTREGQADATISTFTFDLRVGLDLFESGFYVAGGVAGSLVGSSFYDYTERITGPPGFVFGESQQDEIALLTAQAFDNSESFVIEARAGVGILYSVGPLVLNPEFGYTYPLNSLLAPPDTMTYRGFSGSFAMLFKFGELF
ncbi:MAG: hypothetical protein H7X80_11905 [bacterium]|nr:hypothetical protein [Candidatus Kapabacteria bacterium]